MLATKFHYTSWFGASSEPASVMEFGFYPLRHHAYGSRASGGGLAGHITSSGRVDRVTKNASIGLLPIPFFTGTSRFLAPLSLVPSLS